MKESLESARNIHQILIVVCTIICAFGLSIKPNINKFERALKELKMIRSDVTMLNESRVRILKKGITEGLEDSLAEQLVKKLDFDDQTDIEARTISSIEREFYSKWHLADSIVMVKPSLSKVNKIITNKAQETLVLSGLPVELHPVGNGWEWKTVYDPLASYNRFLEPAGIKIDPEPYYKYPIVADANDKIILFPALKGTWEYVKDKNFNDAIITLQNELDDSKEKNVNQIDLAGLKVAGSLMYIAGPCLLFFLLLYLTTLISHILDIINSREDGIKAFEFPWLAIFPNSLGKTLCFLSLQLYPLTVSLLVVYKSFSEYSRNSFIFNGTFVRFEVIWFCSCYLILFGILSIYLHQRIIRLRQKIKFLVEGGQIHP